MGRVRGSPGIRNHTDSRFTPHPPTASRWAPPSPGTGEGDNYLTNATSVTRTPAGPSAPGPGSGRGRRGCLRRCSPSPGSPCGG
ncbi:hypothetical protein E6C67_00745 [Azospirillum sp. TSA2s]|nr:hypothetical protein E6C67_00745 [Azospirillum sp. TSA2s]